MFSVLTGCNGGGGSATPAAPSIAIKQSALTVSAGQPARFSVGAAGTPPLSYQWQKNGTNISGATSANYTDTITTSADNGAAFTVTVTNSVGSVNSAPIILTVVSTGVPVFPQLAATSISAGTVDYSSASYQANLANFNVAILNFWKGWNKNGLTMRNAVQSLKSLNPSLKVAQYTVMNELVNDPTNIATLDIQTKLNQTDWWLRNASGAHVQWTAAFGPLLQDINFTTWTLVDSNGQRYPEWLANRNFQAFFQSVPEFDIWYFDVVTLLPRDKVADWEVNGANQSNTDTLVQTAYRQGHAAEWAAAKLLAPNVITMGNTDNDLSSPEYKGKLQGAFLEALMGKSWSLETWAGWKPMMTQYQTVMTNVLTPAIVVFNAWGSIQDYNFFRYAFASCLMDNGYFSFTDEAQGSSNVPWFDEYGFNLGTAIDPPQKTAAQNGVYIRRFTGGLVLVNPALTSATVSVGTGYRRITGTQDPVTNNGAMVSDNVVLPSKSGLILINQ